MLHLPIVKSPNGDRFKFSAVFKGSRVIISDPIAIQNLHNNGFFGTIILTMNKLSNHTSLTDESESPTDMEKGVKTVHKVEHLHLLLEEAFFLLTLQCLEISDSNQAILDAVHAWKLFNLANTLFTQNYIVYHYYKSKNWIVKSGLKFAGDFLLYRESPETCHSSYVVIIDVVQVGQQPEVLKSRRSMTTPQMSGLNRLVEAAGKQVLVARISYTQHKHLKLDDPACIRDFEIEELILNRVQNKLECK